MQDIASKGHGVSDSYDPPHRMGFLVWGYLHRTIMFSVYPTQKPVFLNLAVQGFHTFET